QAESPLASAAVWKINISADTQRKVVSSSAFARGLRNSMALAVHPTSGLVMQGENGMDLPDEDRPYEELNVLRQDAHYGWPYCHSRAEVSPKFAGTITAEMCAKNYAPPVAFMPAHVAPLSLLYYHGSLLPMLQNKLLVSWHGYRQHGQRIVAYPVDERGVPTSQQYEEVVKGWTGVAGLRPLGAPTGLASLQDGSILILDDKNGAVLRLSRGHQAGNQAPSVVSFSSTSIQAFDKIKPFLQKNCMMCHTAFQKNSSEEILKEMQGSSLLSRQAPFESSFYRKLKDQQMPPEAVRPALGFSDQEYSRILPAVEAFLNTL
ncbi:MAG: PQQ-dependent sugar dehydrogenase, partial [Bdellovibrio sp.]